MVALVNPDTCIGCTLCTTTCSEVFRIEGDKAVAYNNPLTLREHECTRQAAEECPVQAITIKL
jgi:ferredoxin